MSHALGTTGALREPAEEPDLEEDVPSMSVLLVDRDRTFLESANTVLREHGHRATSAGDLDAAERRSRESPDLLFLDETLGARACLDFVDSMRRTHCGTLCVLTSTEATAGSARRAMRAGAWDYLAKPFPARQVVAVVGRAWHALEGSRTLASRSAAAGVELEGGTTIVGASLPMRGALDRALAVARTDASVLLLGESGTGKELFARLIHERSGRARRAFVPVNCAAFPNDLLESEMFGHEKGAFTGAVRCKRGLLETADGGTLFLDEVSEMSPTLQAKLLRVLQDGVVRRVGSESSGTEVDVRFVAATNRRPGKAIREGRLREDLYYRLGVVPIHLPPLRDRPEDVPVLSRHFLARAWGWHRQAEGGCPTLTAEAQEALMERTWPGNVRELRNVIEQIVVFAEPGERIGADSIPPGGEPGGPGEEEGALLREIPYDRPYHEVKDWVLDRFEREYLSRTMNRAGGNVSEAARLSEVDRTTLYRLMDKHGLSRRALSA